jgi:signal transduction histidine kinase
MGLFVGGFFAGLAVTLLLAAVFAYYAYQKIIQLQRRIRHSERLAELGTLTGGLAHEIKNPLSTVQLNLQLLQEDILPETTGYSRIVNRINTVKNETARLRETLDDFLRYAGRLELDLRVVDLNLILEELIDFFSPQAQSQRVQVRLQKAPHPVPAEVDAKFIKQALLNLMLNAVQAMQNGGELILTLAEEGPNAVIHVIDTGSGIPPEAAKQIFQAYYSTKRGGTGLGLPMAKRIAEEHGGELSLKTEVGKGSDFCLVLPLQNAGEPRMNPR